MARPPRGKATRRNGSSARRIATAAGGLLVAVFYTLRIDRTAGLVTDDAWYILLGQSLARGDGFRLASSPDPILPAVPPGFPALLASVFWCQPRFPDNVIALKSISFAAMLIAGALVAVLLRQTSQLPRSMVAGVAVATMLTPAFVFLATSTVMAECVFMMTQIAAMLAVERAARDDAPVPTIAAGALVTVAWLVRSAGVALAGAALCYLLARRSWRRTSLFAVAVAACAVPWVTYALRHAPTAAQRASHGGSIVVSYADAMRMRIAGSAASGRVGLADAPRRVAANLANVAGRDVGALIVPGIYRAATESGEEVVSLGGSLGLLAGSMGNATATLLISTALSAIVGIGFVVTARERLTLSHWLVLTTVAMVAVYPYWTFRFVLPLAPFILLFLLRGIGWLAVAIAGRGSADSAEVWRPARLALACLLGLQVLEHSQYVLARRDPLAVPWLADARAVDDLVEWMQRHLTDDGMVASTNPALIYLRTGRQGVTLEGSSERWAEWRSRGIRYLVSLRASDLPPETPRQRVVYEDVVHHLWIIAI